MSAIDARNAPAPAASSLSRQILLDIYRKALLINVFDERMRSLLSSGRLAAVYYSPRGQEILAAALLAALEEIPRAVVVAVGLAHAREQRAQRLGAIARRQHVPVLADALDLPFQQRMQGRA